MFGAQGASQEPWGFLGSAPATSKGALGKVDQVHRGPFWGVLDRLKYVRAQILIVKPGNINIFIFRSERFLEGPEGVPGACSAAKAAPEEVPGARSGAKAEPKGGQKRSIDFFWAPGGGQIGTSVEKLAFGK